MNRRNNQRDSPLESNTSKSIPNSIANKIEEVSDKSKAWSNTIKDKVGSLTGKAKNAVKETTNQIPSSYGTQWNAVQSGVTSFAESNSAISKFVFVLVLMFLFVVLFNAGIALIQSMLGSDRQPLLLDGMVSANKTTKVSVNPNVKKSKPLYRSINEDQGLEFTWNVWFYVDSLNSNHPAYSRIFSKGSANEALDLNIPSSCTDDSCKNIFNSSPGLFITQNAQNDSVFPNTVAPTQVPNHINLMMLINTFQPSKTNQEFAESITIENVPVQKWVCATLRVQQTTVDIYINGVMTQRKKLNNLPRQNYYDVLIGDQSNGFQGNIASLRYFNKAISYDEIQSLFAKGPNLKSIEQSGVANGVDYISMNWYYK